MDPKDLEVTPEEQTAETESLTEVNIDELKVKLAEDLGIDPETEVELLDKLVEREKASRERTSKAIKQKIKFREQLKLTSDKSKSDKADPGKSQTPDIQALIKEAFEQRDLASLELAEELKEEIKDLAKLKGISITEATKLPYIQSRKEAIEREAKILQASPTRKGGGNYKSAYDTTKAPDPDNFDLNTEEGRKDWTDAKAAFKEARKATQ